MKNYFYFIQKFYDNSQKKNEVIKNSLFDNSKNNILFKFLTKIKENEINNQIIIVIFFSLIFIKNLDKILFFELSKREFLISSLFFNGLS